ncbi:MAG: glycosyltransferase family 1 protein [Caldimicrobium sp.]
MSCQIFINGKFLTQRLTGVQRFAYEVSKRLIQLDQEIKLISPSPPMDIYCFPKEKIIIDKSAFKGVIWEQLKLPQILKKFSQPPLLNLGNTAPLFYENNIVVIHDLAWMRYPEAFSRKFYLWYRFLIPKIARRALLIYTVSEFSKKEIVEELKVKPEKIKVVYNGVNEKFKPLGLKREKFILWVGSLQPYKNLENLLKAFWIFRKDFSDYKLCLVGRFDARVFRSAELPRVEGVEVLGEREDEALVSLYNRASLLIFPSLYEGFGLPPLEAMACGCPVVASLIPSLKEIYEEAVFYVNPRDPEDIARGIKKVLTDETLRSELIARGLSKAKEYTWDRTVEEIFKSICRLINKTL